MVWQNRPMPVDRHPKWAQGPSRFKSRARSMLKFSIYHRPTSCATIWAGNWNWSTIDRRAVSFREIQVMKIRILNWHLRFCLEVNISLLETLSTRLLRAKSRKSYSIRNSSETAESPCTRQFRSHIWTLHKGLYNRIGESPFTTDRRAK